MSALAGVFRRDGGFSQGTLARLSRSLRHLGPDGESFAVASPVGMVHRPFHTISASRWWQQPLQGSGGELLAWDGRLDNGAGLALELGLGAGAAEDDPRIALAAYCRWGMSGLARLIGDFALALWDPSAARLVLARDAFGVRPLYYVSDHESVVWASSLRALLERPGAGTPEVDDDYVADFLARPEPSFRTPYRNLRAVPPGCAVVFGATSEEVRHLWCLEPEPRVLLSGDEEYEERFRELFREAVRARLRAEGPVFAELSGDLDTSSIVCMADKVLAACETKAGRLETISHISVQAARNDERSYIRAMETRRGKIGLHLCEDDHPILSPIPEDAFLEFPTAEHAYAARHRDVERTLRQAGARVLLCGHGGPQVTGGLLGLPLEPADLLWEKRPVRFLRSLHAWSRALRLPHGQLFWEGVVFPLLPRHRRSVSAVVASAIPNWLDPGFQSRTAFMDRMLGGRSAERFRRPSDRLHALMIQSCVEAGSRGLLTEGCIEPSYPFLHRPLVEFLAAIPLGQRIRPGQDRSLIRRALAGLLPPKIAARTRKTGPDFAFYRAVAREWRWISPLLAQPRIAARGWVDARRLRIEFERARHGASVDTAAMLKVLSLELWLRFLERWRPSLDETLPVFPAFRRPGPGERRIS
ncbi:MAG TPA: asparagine synthase-related protein [Thermoanaerobaculia bacterium]